MTAILICPDCGLAFTDEREHRNWHVDRNIQRIDRRSNYAAYDAHRRAALAGLTDAELAQHRMQATAVREGREGERRG